MQIDKHTRFWQYLSSGQQALIENGLFLRADVKNHPGRRAIDYSYLVFSFAKAYEGFLKQLFLDLGFITKKQYQSNHFRVGKVLSPNLQKRLKERSVYHRLCKHQGSQQLADRLWRAWKRGRNQVFHYFPHNLKAIDASEAEDIVAELLAAMQAAYAETKPLPLALQS